jgi:hypothetical protein
MMKTLQRIGILIFLAVFLVGTTGLSIFEHICTCQGKTEITLFPEIFDHRSSCCCSEAEVEMVTPDHVHLCGLEQATHCKNIKFFIKAAISPAPVVVKTFSFLAYAEWESPVTPYLNYTGDESAATWIIPPGSSPPVTGRQKVIAFHQLKFPVPHLSFV